MGRNDSRPAQVIDALNASRTGAARFSRSCSLPISYLNLESNLHSPTVRHTHALVRVTNCKEKRAVSSCESGNAD